MNRCFCALVREKLFLCAFQKEIIIVKMAAVKRFEDLDCWKAGKDLYIKLRQFISGSPIEKEYYLKDQLLRAGLSVSNNIAEGFERGGDKEFRRYLIISNGSASEVQSMLLILTEVYPDLKSTELKDLLTLAQKCLNLNKGLIRYLNSKSS